MTGVEDVVASSSSIATFEGPDGGYRHEALLYRDHHEFIELTLRFIEDAIELEEPILVVLSTAKIEELRAMVGGQGQVLFADMEEVGRNPARIIPTWREFLCRHSPATRFRGMGEPIVPGQDRAKRIESEHHEALLNIAFSNWNFWLMCPYDMSALEQGVIDEARRNHPLVFEHGRSQSSRQFPGAEMLAEPLSDALPAPPDEAVALDFQEGDLRDVRRFVEQQGTLAGIDPKNMAEFVIAANEIATNSIRHGGERGTVCAWQESGWFVCEIRDDGQIGDPLIGRVRPTVGERGGRGLWIANQICDLVQIRVGEAGGVVRLRTRIQ